MCSVFGPHTEQYVMSNVQCASLRLRVWRDRRQSQYSQCIRMICDSPVYEGWDLSFWVTMMFFVISFKKRSRYQTIWNRLSPSSSQMAANFVSPQISKITQIFKSPNLTCDTIYIVNTGIFCDTFNPWNTGRAWNMWSAWKTWPVWNILTT